MYWHGKGKEFTNSTVQMAVEAAKENGINHLVVASYTGYTAKLLINSGLKVVCVTHANGYRNAGENEIDETTRKELKEAGIKVLTTTHVLSGVEKACSKKFGGIYPAEIIAHTLRMLGQGVKVCVEVSVMALDAGLIPYGERIMTVAGTGHGADTAVIICPDYSNNIFATYIERIICKPA